MINSIVLYFDLGIIPWEFLLSLFLSVGSFPSPALSKPLPIVLISPLASIGKTVLKAHQEACALPLARGPDRDRQAGADTTLALALVTAGSTLAGSW